VNTRRDIAETVRELDPDLAEAIELELFTNPELAEELRTNACKHQKVSTAFFTLLAAASALEDLS